MTTLARDANNDIHVTSDGKFAIASGLACYYDILHAAVLTIQGELLLNTERGIPYFDTIFQHPNKVLFWQSSMQSVISSFSFVRTIKSFNYDIDYDKKLLTYTIKVETTDGDVTLEG